MAVFKKGGADEALSLCDQFTKKTFGKVTEFNHQEVVEHNFCTQERPLFWIEKVPENLTEKKRGGEQLPQGIFTGAYYWYSFGGFL